MSGQAIVYPFLMLEKGQRREVCQKNQDFNAWFDFEEYLNTMVRQNLRKELKEQDQSFRDMPVVLMRACIYVRVMIAYID